MDFEKERLSGRPVSYLPIIRHKHYLYGDVKFEQQIHSMYVISIWFGQRTIQPSAEPELFASVIQIFAKQISHIHFMCGEQYGNRRI